MILPPWLRRIESAVLRLASRGTRDQSDVVGQGLAEGAAIRDELLAVQA
ncbi:MULTISPECIES: hypothetical protein [Streptomyces]|nr:hypothetical protein [Streptomyces sp. ME02-6979.5a]MDX3342537.1 hypothetical protein [Streptomyces sp. ME02-6979.5a]